MCLATSFHPNPSIFHLPNHRKISKVWFLTLCFRSTILKYKKKYQFCRLGRWESAGVEWKQVNIVACVSSVLGSSFGLPVSGKLTVIPNTGRCRVVLPWFKNSFNFFSKCVRFVQMGNKKYMIQSLWNEVYCFLGCSVVEMKKKAKILHIY